MKKRTAMAEPATDLALSELVAAKFVMRGFLFEPTRIMAAGLI
jgi:hypothetical protein